MSGRAQAANLTGMLSQLAGDVGELGKAYDWTHQNIRDLSAPQLDTNDPQSLMAYSTWAKRNGNHEDAQKYAQMATDLGVQQQKQAWTTQLSAYQNGADQLTRQLRNEDLTPEDRAKIQESLDTIYSQMNTYGAQGAKYGGTGREGSDYRDTMEERENRNKLVQQQILSNKLDIEKQVNGTKRLSRIAFPEGPAADRAFERYNQRADMVTDGNYGAINADYRPFIMSGIEKSAARYQDIVQADYQRLEDTFNSEASAIIARTYSDDPEVASEAEAELAALTTEYGEKFSSDEYKPYNNKGMDSRVTAAQGTVLAANDAAIARERAGIELQMATQNLVNSISQNTVLNRSDFPNSTLYEKYLGEVEQQKAALGDRGVGEVNKRYKSIVEKHLTSLAEAVPQQLQGDINKVLAGLRKDNEDFAAIFNPNSWDDEDADTLSKAIHNQMYKTLDKAGNSIMEKYNSIDQSTPEGRAQASQLINQAIFSALEYQFPTLYDQMREDLDEDLDGMKIAGVRVTDGQKGDQRAADAKSDRWNRIEGDLALGTGAKYKEKLKEAQDKYGEDFDKDAFDRRWELYIKEVGRDKDPVSDEYLSQDTAWRI